MITIYRGLPGCGKSTHAQKMIDEHGGVRVGRDHLRWALYGEYYNPERINEDLITKMQNAAIESAVKSGQHVFVDDMNLRNRYVTRFIEMAQALKTEYTIIDMTDTSVDLCQMRDSARDKQVGARVIYDLYERFIKGKPHPLPVHFASPSLPQAGIEPYTPPTAKYTPTCVVCDLDGTLAMMSDRSPFEWARVGEDTPNEFVHYIMLMLQHSGLPIVFLSGRDSVCRPETEEWLKRMGFAEGKYELYMREENDMRRDSIVKLELFNKFIRNKYDVLGVIDDRQQVVDVWNALGLRVLQAHNFGKDLNF